MKVVAALRREFGGHATESITGERSGGSAADTIADVAS
jgi:hypothetical protein